MEVQIDGNYNGNAKSNIKTVINSFNCVTINTVSIKMKDEGFDANNKII